VVDIIVLSRGYFLLASCVGKVIRVFAT
jgi:hypothetical protein